MVLTSRVMHTEREREREAHFIPRRISSEPDWKGMWKNWHILGSSAQARTSRSVKYLPPYTVMR